MANIYHYIQGYSHANLAAVHLSGQELCEELLSLENYLKNKYLSLVTNCEGNMDKTFF